MKPRWSSRSGLGKSGKEADATGLGCDLQSILGGGSSTDRGNDHVGAEPIGQSSDFVPMGSIGFDLDRGVDIEAFGQFKTGRVDIHDDDILGALQA